MPYTNINGTAATVVYYPATSGVPHAFLFNPGPSPAYLGGNPGVTTVTGVPLAPGNSMKLQTAYGTIYGVAGYSQASPFGTVNAATTYPGGTTLTVNSAGTAFGTGSTIVVEPGTVRQEFATVFASQRGDGDDGGGVQLRPRVGDHVQRGDADVGYRAGGQGRVLMSVTVTLPPGCSSLRMQDGTPLQRARRRPCQRRRRARPARPARGGRGCGARGPRVVPVVLGTRTGGGARFVPELGPRRARAAARHASARVGDARSASVDDAVLLLRAHRSRGLARAGFWRCVTLTRVGSRRDAAARLRCGPAPPRTASGQRFQALRDRRRLAASPAATVAAPHRLTPPRYRSRPDARPRGWQTALAGRAASERPCMSAIARAAQIRP